MRNITIPAYAKVNLFLNIDGIDDNGYHLLTTVMQTIDLHDTVTVEAADGGITVTCDDGRIPSDEKNICYRAAEIFLAQNNLDGARIHIEKRIPTESGMGGGSADAAAVLRGLNSLCGSVYTDEQLLYMGAKIGADVPFCLIGGTALCRGIGEVITPIPALPQCKIAVIKPASGISTRQAYENYDKNQYNRYYDADNILHAIKEGDIETIAASMRNSLEDVCGLPEIAAIKEYLLSRGAVGAMMTGSGSAVFGIFKDTPLPSADPLPPLDNGEPYFVFGI
ncbi:MAG: 4-(cytidine 5'-diphospho)-2-C-methyl-D-erythritol kinase [Oscillospiraceae bacterium]|nr:4-(cytidine 5'-diphospho)-2-C-methyl-D-erythritol kinase [Oscillospiraceae bacterium]